MSPTNPSISILGNPSKNKLNYYVWKDVTNEKNVTYIPNVVKSGIARKLWALFRRLTLSKKLPCINFRHKIFDFIAYNILRKAITTDILIVSYVSLDEVGLNALDRLLKQNVKIILFLFDPLIGLSPHFQSLILSGVERGIFSAVYSFDPADCKKYNFKYWEQIYSGEGVNEITNIVYPIKRPIVYFAGRNKGRIQMLYDFIHIFEFSKISCVIRLPEYKLDNEKTKGVVILKEMVDYRQILSEVAGADIILDIIQSNQTGLSWRIIEAFIFNKKLITNNKSVVKSPYYNPDWIQVFDKPSDINIDWCYRDVDIQYNYQNDYSPKRFIDIISQNNY